MNPIQLDYLEFMFAVCAAAVGLIGCVIVYRNENRRRLRLRFQEILETRVTSTDELQEKLATQIGHALETKNAVGLERVTLAPYLEDYIVDFDFKNKLYHFLLGYVRDRRLVLSVAEVRKILEVMDVWKEQKDELEEEVLRHIGEAAKDSRDAKSVQAFIHSRPQYLGDKTTHFVDDVREVVEAVAAKS